eukprot:6205582-Pleurochrysis_carterae.AAC.2
MPEAGTGATESLCDGDHHLGLSLPVELSKVYITQERREQGRRRRLAPMEAGGSKFAQMIDGTQCAGYSEEDL